MVQKICCFDKVFKMHFQTLSFIEGSEMLWLPFKHLDLIEESLQNYPPSWHLYNASHQWVKPQFHFYNNSKKALFMGVFLWWCQKGKPRAAIKNVKHGDCALIHTASSFPWKFNNFWCFKETSDLTSACAITHMYLSVWHCCHLFFHFHPLENIAERMGKFSKNIF